MADEKNRNNPGEEEYVSPQIPTEDLDSAGGGTTVIMTQTTIVSNSIMNTVLNVSPGFTVVTGPTVATSVTYQTVPNANSDDSDK